MNINNMLSYPLSVPDELTIGQAKEPAVQTTEQKNIYNFMPLFFIIIIILIVIKL